MFEKKIKFRFLAYFSILILSILIIIFHNLNTFKKINPDEFALGENNKTDISINKDFLCNAKKKYINIANGMLDSLLRGAGIGGSIVSVGKNAIIKLVKELEKDRPKLQNIASEIIKISPPVSAKYSRLVQAGKSYDWNKEEMKEKGLSLDNPAYLAGANVVSALTNIPLDRVIKKANNVVSATSQDLETWERLALLGGWQDWEIGIEKENKSNKPQPRKVVKKKVIKKKLVK